MKERAVVNRLNILAYLMRRVLRILLTIPHGAPRARCQLVQSLMHMGAHTHLSHSMFVAEQGWTFVQLVQDTSPASLGAERLRRESKDPVALAFEVIHHGPNDVPGTTDTWDSQSMRDYLDYVKRYLHLGRSPCRHRRASV